MKFTNLLRGVLVAASLSATSLFANHLPTVVLTSTGFNGNPNAGAGEFLAVTSDDGSFITFCLEAQVTVSLGATYSYTIDDAVMNQGILNQADPISKGTAYLYTKFVNGVLTGPSGNGSYLGGTNPIHDVNAGLLQKAFWMLEDEINYDNSNFYVALVELVYGSQAKAQANYTGDAVKALNVWTETRRGLTDRQSMLVYVPDSGMTALLLGLGLLSLAAIRRKA